jgi:hypothetical protein
MTLSLASYAVLLSKVHPLFLCAGFSPALAAPMPKTHA